MYKSAMSNRNIFYFKQFVDTDINTLLNIKVIIKSYLAGLVVIKTNF